MLQDLSPVRHHDLLQTKDLFGLSCFPPFGSPQSIWVPSSVHLGPLLSPGLLEDSPDLPLSPCVVPSSTGPTGNSFGVCQPPPLPSPKGVEAAPAPWRAP